MRTQIHGRTAGYLLSSKYDLRRPSAGGLGRDDKRDQDYRIKEGSNRVRPIGSDALFACNLNGWRFAHGVRHRCCSAKETGDTRCKIPRPNGQPATFPWPTVPTPGNRCSVRAIGNGRVPHRLPATFYAHVKQHDFAGAGIVETVCDPCAGQRTSGQVRHDDELYVGVQLTTSGRERFRIGDSGVEVATGDVVVWTTGQVVEFEVLERLHKVTLMIPWSVMRERLPERKQPPIGGKIESRTGVGSLLAVHLLALSNEIATLDESVQGSVSRSTLELLGIALSDNNRPRPSTPVPPCFDVYKTSSCNICMRMT